MADVDKAEEFTPAPADHFRIYRPTLAETGELIGVELVETYVVRPSMIEPPLGARLQALAYETGVEHIYELEQVADGPTGLAASAAAGRAIVDQAAEQAAEAQRVVDAKTYAAHRARIEELTQPVAFAKATAAAAIEAEHAQLAEFATAKEVKQLDAVKKARLAALDEQEAE
jgi:hypothetical protein